MNISDNANAFSVVKREKVIFINFSSYVSGKGDDKKYANFTGVVFIKNASEHLLSQVDALEEALNDNKNVPVNVEGYLNDLDTTESEGYVYPKLEITVTKLQGTRF